MPSIDDETAAFRHQVDLIRGTRALGRSDAMLRLFDFLAETSRDGRAPKEAEVADRVFARGAGFDAVQDASVRVHVHRLRRKLDDFYGESGGAEAMRLTVPRGEYRLVLVPRDVPDAGPLHPTRPGGRWPAGRLRIEIGLAAVLLVALVAAAVAPLLRPVGTDSELWALRDSPVWTPIINSPRPIVVVIGDYYIFGEADQHGRVRRLVREYAINSHYDLDQHIMRHPELYGRYVDVGLRYYPVSIGDALNDILPILRTPGHAKDRLRIIPASDLTPELLRSSNIVYIGYLSGLGALRNPVFNGGSYAAGSSYDELIDKRSGRTLEGTSASGASGPQRDFGYVSLFPGPSGTSIIVVAGTRDAAVRQAAEFVSNRDSLARMISSARGSKAFDALLQVDTLGDASLGGKLVAVQSLDRAAIWRAGAEQQFPDDAEDDKKGR